MNTIKLTTTLIVLTLALTSVSCKSKQWNKEYISKTFMEGLKKQGGYQPGKSERICDCVADKMVSTFKNEEEANNKPTEVIAMSSECVKEVQEHDKDNNKQ